MTLSTDVEWTSDEPSNWEGLLAFVHPTLAICDWPTPAHKAFFSAIADKRNPDVVSVWQCLVGLPKARKHAFFFFYAAWFALQYEAIRAMVTDAKKRDGENFDSTFDPLIAIFAASRKKGSQSDYVRAFRAELHRFGFPCSVRGVQDAVLKTTCIALQDPGVTPEVVSRVWREFAEIVPTLE